MRCRLNPFHTAPVPPGPMSSNELFLYHHFLSSVKPYLKQYALRTGSSLPLRKGNHNPADYANRRQGMDEVVQMCTELAAKYARSESRSRGIVRPDLEVFDLERAKKEMEDKKKEINKSGEEEGEEEEDVFEDIDSSVANAVRRPRAVESDRNGKRREPRPLYVFTSQTDMKIPIPKPWRLHSDIDFSSMTGARAAALLRESHVPDIAAVVDEWEGVQLQMIPMIARESGLLKAAVGRQEADGVLFRLLPLLVRHSALAYSVTVMRKVLNRIEDIEADGDRPAAWADDMEYWVGHNTKVVLALKRPGEKKTQPSRAAATPSSIPSSSTVEPEVTDRQAATGPETSSP